VGCRIQHPTVQVEGQAVNRDRRKATSSGLPRRVTAQPHEDTEVGRHVNVSRIPIDGKAGNWLIAKVVSEIAGPGRRVCDWIFIGRLNRPHPDNLQMPLHETLRRRFSRCGFGQHRESAESNQKLGEQRHVHKKDTR